MILACAVGYKVAPLGCCIHRLCFDSSRITRSGRFKTRRLVMACACILLFISSLSSLLSLSLSLCLALSHSAGMVCLEPKDSKRKMHDCMFGRWKCPCPGGADMRKSSRPNENIMRAWRDGELELRLLFAKSGASRKSWPGYAVFRFTEILHAPSSSRWKTWERISTTPLTLV